jgi:hypothetical protein
VRALDLGSITTGAQPLQGSISAGLGGLSELVLLDLSQNKLTWVVARRQPAAALTQRGCGAGPLDVHLHVW